MQKYIVSNLIMENSFIDKLKNTPKEYSEDTYDGIKVSRLNVKNSDSGAEAGRYITVELTKMWEMKEEEALFAANIISSELKSLAEATLGRGICRDDIFLVAGMGNRHLASDSIGPLTVDKINVTRHVGVVAPSVLKRSGLCSVCAVECGVLGDTGIRSAEVLCGLVKTVKPTVIVAVDALAARTQGRLGTTVQISDTGISPGAGIGNRQTALNRQTLGVPVIAIGVPTVISAATLVGDMLMSCGEQTLSESLEEQLKAAQSFFVAPKECELLSSQAAQIIACAINGMLDISFVR